MTIFFGTLIQLLIWLAIWLVSMENADWESCIICIKSDGDLRCPVDSLQNNALDAYNKFLEVVEKFHNLNALPIDVKFEGENLGGLFYHHRSKWHKSCHLKFAASKLNRIKDQRGKKHESDDQRKSRRKLDSCANEESCIFCSQASGKLHHCATMNLDCDLRRIAKDLQDTTLMAKLSGGDLIAIEAKYHYNCLSSYKNRYRSYIRSLESCDSNKTEENLMQARAFAELVCYIESRVENGDYIFKLSHLHTLFKDRLCNLGIEKNINKTRSKEQLLCHFSCVCQKQPDGKNSLLVFNDGLQKLLKDTITYRDFDSEAILMAQLAKVMRQ